MNLFFNSVLILAITIGSNSLCIQAVTKTIDVNKSTATWYGNKIGGGHNGVIKLKSGMLEFDQGKLVGGNFAMNMSSLTVTDLSGEDKQELETYLKKKSFFGTSAYPTATLLINKVTQTSNGTYTVEADLKIKKTTEPISFELKMTDNTAKTRITIDRSKFDVKDGSTGFFSQFKDEFIKNDFEVEVNLVY